MEINEWWNYILSFTIYSSNDYMYYKIIATLFFIGGLLMLFTGFTQPFLLKGGKLMKYSSNPRRDEYSGLMTILLGLCGISFVILPLLYFTLPSMLFILLHDVIFRRKP